MISPWKNLLLREENALSQVVICMYNYGWVPIKVVSLAEAMNFYQIALLHGAEIFVFPSELAPWSSQALEDFIETK